MASLIPFDCSEDEAALLIKRALDDLKGSTDEIFSRATNRMNEYQTRLDGYRRRFALVERKFEQIQKSDEVPLITSPAEFPGKIHLSRPLVFRPNAYATPFIPPTEKLQRDCATKTLPIKDMLKHKTGYRFLFPKGKHNEALLSVRADDQLSNLLKFDRKHKGIAKAEEFYKLKPTTAVDKSVSEKLTANSESLLIYGSLTTNDQSDPFTYKPGGAKSLTEFDLPDVLPQLTGVANRESIFGTTLDDDSEEEEDIFGGVKKKQAHIDLSARSTFYFLDDSTLPRSIQSRASDYDLPGPSSSVIPPAPTIKEIIPPQNIPPPPIAPPRSIDGIPPAPPPLPPSAILASIPSPPMPTNGGRADLMEAIRAAGGTKKAGLKKISEQKDDEPEVMSKKAPESTEDLMSSLTKALERRRKGISGKTAKKFEALEKTNKSGANSTFASLRELIPAPTQMAESDSDTGVNDEDWK